MHDPLILTIQLDLASFDYLNALRAAHFPPARNLVPAHITLFHALPGAEEQAIRAGLAEEVAATGPVPLGFPGVRFLGRGVALQVEAPALLELRGRLAQRWWDWLGAQDRHPYKPHVTIQNKVAAPTARALFEQLQANWKPRAGSGTGLALWRYKGGPWEAAASYGFNTAGLD